MYFRHGQLEVKIAATQQQLGKLVPKEVWFETVPFGVLISTGTGTKAA
jgi:hypothetical protein